MWRILSISCMILFMMMATFTLLIKHMLGFTLKEQVTSHLGHQSSRGAGRKHNQRMESHVTHQTITNISTSTTTTTTTKKTTCVAATDDIRISLMSVADVRCDGQLGEDWLGFPDSETQKRQEGAGSHSLGFPLLHLESDLR